MKEIQLSGIVGSDIAPAQIKEFIESAGGDEIAVSLSTPGGYLYEAFQIHNLIADYPGKKTVTLNGQVMSAGTYIATAFDRVVARENTVFMIHNAMNVTFGDYRAHEKEAQELRSLNGIMNAAYAKKSKKSKKDISDAMDAETYYHGQEVVDAGFADEIQSSGQTAIKENDLTEARVAFKGLALPNLAGDAHRACEYVNSMAAKKERVPAEVFAEIRSAIADGSVDEGSWNEKDGDVQYFDNEKRFPWGKNGIVYQSALRLSASRAGQVKRLDISALAGDAIKLIQGRAKNQKTGGYTLENKEEAIQLLKNAIANEHLTHSEIATSLGFADRLITTEQRAAVAVVAALKEMGVDDPVAVISKLKADEKANEETVKNAALDTAFGAKEENGKPNALRIYAGKQLASVSMKEIAAKIEEVKNDPIALELAGKRADVYNPINIVDGQNAQSSGDAIGSNRVDVV